MKGRTAPDECKAEAMILTAKVFDRFREEFGDVLCGEILKDGDVGCPGQVVPACARILAEAMQGEK